MTTLLPDVEAFLAANPNMSATRFGNNALADRHFVRQLRAGRRVWPETDAKVREFMRQYDAGDHASADTAGSQTASPGKDDAKFRERAA